MKKDKSNRMVKELKKLKMKGTKAVEDQLLDETKQLLLKARDEDQEILSKLGLDHRIRYEQELQSDIVRSRQAEAIYSKEAFTGKQIKSLCNKYHLKCLSVGKYNGSIPPELPRKIRDFCAANQLRIDADKFFILAPMEQFRNIEHVPISKDPVLLYRTDGRTYDAQETDVFVAVYNWGNDFIWHRIFKTWTLTYRRTDEDASALAATWIATVVLGIGMAASLLWGWFYVGFAAAAIWTMIMIGNSQKKKFDRLWNEAVV